MKYSINIHYLSNIVYIRLYPVYIHHYNIYIVHINIYSIVCHIFVSSIQFHPSRKAGESIYTNCYLDFGRSCGGRVGPPTYLRGRDMCEEMLYLCVFTMGSLEHVHNMSYISMSVITLQAPFCNGSFSSTPLPSYTQLFSTDAWYSCDTIPTPKMFKNSCCLRFGIPEWVDIPLSSTFLGTFSGWLLEHQDLDVAGDATPRRTVASLRNGDGQLQLCGSECVVGLAKCKPFQFFFTKSVSCWSQCGVWVNVGPCETSEYIRCLLSPWWLFWYVESLG
jgi:hypothetical protein